MVEVEDDARKRRKRGAIANLALGFGGILSLTLFIVIVERADVQPTSDEAANTEQYSPTPDTSEIASDEFVEQAPDDSNPAITALINDLGYNPPLHEIDYEDCHDRDNAINPKVTAYGICNDQAFNQCPYSADGNCTVSAIFVNGHMRNVSFQYQYDNSDLDKLKQVLDRKFGYTPVKFTGPGSIDLSSWNSEWKDGSLRISLLHSRGTNFYGVPYDNAWVVFSDTSLPEPLDEK